MDIVDFVIKIHTIRLFTIYQIHANFCTTAKDVTSE